MAANGTFLVINSKPIYDAQQGRDWLLLLAITLVATFLRFWGLGIIGLHGDEETMGLAVKGIIETGTPVLPSGMYYGRGIAHTFLMTASAMTFGLSEWSLRLPSAIAGVLMVVAAYFLGRRFLPARWTLLFAGIVAFSPSLIAISQTARMYVFFVLLMMVFATLIFRWERTGRIHDYFLALAVFLVGLQFHRLSIFAGLLFLFPGIVKLSPRLLTQGGVALAVCAAAYKLTSDWVASHYFDTVRMTSGTNSMGDVGHLGAQGDLAPSVFVAIGLFAVAMVAVCLVAIRSLDQRTATLEKTAVIVLLVVAIVGVTVFQGHIGLLSLLLATILFLRFGGRPVWALTIVALIGVLVFAEFVVLDQFLGFDDRKEIVMAILGLPNPWPYLRFASFFPTAIAIYFVFVLFFVVSYVRGKGIPDHIVFMLVSVWAPVFLIGWFEGHIPQRYVIGCVPFFLLAFLAGSYRIIERVLAGGKERPAVAMFALIVILLSVIRPLELYYNVFPQYSDFAQLGGHRGADHKGAAEFIESLDLASDDVVMAEDILQQTYYLGRVDFWLRRFTVYTYLPDGVPSDIYTGTPHLGNADELQKVLDSDQRGAIYIIGSGETARNPSEYLTPQMLSLIARSQPQVVYEGRDKKTKVLRIPPN